MASGSDSVLCVSKGGGTPQREATSAFEVWGRTAWARSNRRLSFASAARNGVVLRSSSYAVVERARVDSRKTITTLRLLVCGVSANLVWVGGAAAASFVTFSGVASSPTIMFATASLEKALPAPVALGSSEREKSESAATHATSGLAPARPPPRVGRCQPWVTRRVIIAGPTVP